MVAAGKSTLMLCLSDVLVDVQIVDTDPQGTLTSNSKFTNRNTSIEESDAKAKYIIYDTPPYHSEEYKSFFCSVDLVIMLIKLG